MSTTRVHVITAMLIWLIPPVASADDKVEPRRTIAVSGQGEVKAAPDTVLVSFAVETSAAHAGDATAENAKRSAAVSAAIKALLDAKDTLTTSRYGLEPRYENPKPGELREPRIIGYVARNEVQVESHKIDAVGALIDAATGAGANRISSLQFSLSQRAEAQRAALEKAGSDARAQAESVAKGLGVRLKGVVSAATSAAPVPVPRFFEARAMAAEARPATPIEPGEVSVNVTLQVTYEIE
ncbi:MAG TPA: SIMPL domain-containing protein [Candidatus Binatia bacterium]|nr:SIMPL domain-containing protein [Candidatus Binatia bacterium]